MKLPIWWWVLLFVLCVIVGLQIAHAGPGLSRPLTLERARLALSTAGFNPGKIFADDENRYLLKSVHTSQKRPGVFVLEVEIDRLPKWAPSSQ